MSSLGSQHLVDERGTCNRSMIARMVPRASLSSSVGATLGTNLKAAALIGPWPLLSLPDSQASVLRGWLAACRKDGPPQRHIVHQ